MAADFAQITNDPAFEKRIAMLLEVGTRALSPVFEQIAVKAAETIGAGTEHEMLRIRKIYKVRSQTGQFTPEHTGLSLYGEKITKAGPYQNFTGDGLVWPDPELGSNQLSSIPMDIPMWSGTGMIDMHEVLKIMETSNNYEAAGKVLADEAQGAVDRVNFFRQHAFFASGNKSYQFALVNANSEYAVYDNDGTGGGPDYSDYFDNDTLTDSILMIDFAAAGNLYAIHRVAEGTMVDLLSVSSYDPDSTVTGDTVAAGSVINQITDSGTTVRCRGVCISSDVGTGRAYFAFFADDDIGSYDKNEQVPLSAFIPDLSSGTLPAGFTFRLVPYKLTSAVSAGTAFMPLGLNDFLKNTGNLLGSQAVAGATFNVDVHTFGKSIGYNASGKPLTPAHLMVVKTRLDSMLQRFPGQKPNLMFTTPGVQQQYMENKIVGQELEGSGMIDATREGAAGRIKFTFLDGSSMTMQIDDNCDAGRLYIINSAAELYRPPDPAGGNDRSAPGIPAPRTPIEFPARRAGWPSAVVPVSATSGNFSRFTLKSMIPFMVREQFVLSNPIGYVGVNFAESKFTNTLASDVHTLD